MQDDGKNLANVCHEVSQLPSHRAYLSIAISAARRVPVVVQHVERAPGTPALVVLLFPTECHPLLVSGVLSRSSSQASSPRHVQVEKENLLQICEDPYHAEHEIMVGLGNASLDAVKEANGGGESELDLEGKLRHLRLEDKSCEEETRVACDVQ